MNFFKVLFFCCLPPVSCLPNVRRIKGRLSDMRSSQHRGLSGSATQEPKYLCRIKHEGNATASVIQKGNYRYLDFNDEYPESYEAKQSCGNTLCQEQDAVVDDVTECPTCPCDEPGEVSLDHLWGGGQNTMEKYVHGICDLASAEKPIDILLIGLGGGGMHRRLVRNCAQGTRVRTIEYDKNVKNLAERFFGLSLSPGVSEVQVGDALEVVSELAKSKTQISPQARTQHSLGASGWDAVVVDCYDYDGQIPESCKNKQFLSALLQILKPNGTVLQHIYASWNGEPEYPRDYSNALQTYSEVFGQNHIRVALINDDQRLIQATAR